MKYLSWSKNLNIHFGYWIWGVNPIRRESMLAQMNEATRRYLQLENTSSPTLLDVGMGGNNDPICRVFAFA